jgi:hypothetical protein
VTHHRQSEVGGPIKAWTTSELSITAKQVCNDCNGGWMNDLENEARPYLTPMIQGRSIHLYREGQTAVASWAVKTALAANLTTPEKPAPTEHYREITATRRPPRQTQVWLAACDGSVAAHHRTSELSLDSGTDHADGYATTVSIGHLAVQIFGHIWVEDITVRPSSAWAQATQQIWAINGEPVIWPPSIVLDISGLAALARRFES